jgi:hypothetical protein
MSWMPLVSVPATVVEEMVHEHGLEDMTTRLLSRVHGNENEDVSEQQFSNGIGY